MWPLLTNESPLLGRRSAFTYSRRNVVPQMANNYEERRRMFLINMLRAAAATPTTTAATALTTTELTFGNRSLAKLPSRKAIMTTTAVIA